MYTNNTDDIQAVIESTKEQDPRDLDAAYVTQDTTAVLEDSGAFIVSNHVSSFEHPTAAEKIKWWFMPTAPAAHGGATTGGIQHIVIRNPDKEDKDGLAQNGLTKLSLFLISGVVNVENKKVTNLT